MTYKTADVPWLLPTFFTEVTSNKLTRNNCKIQEKKLLHTLTNKNTHIYSLSTENTELLRSTSSHIHTHI